MKDETRLIHAGRHPEQHGGAVNPPVTHASTILLESVAAWEQSKLDYAADKPGNYYGRYGTTSQKSLCEALCELEGGYRTQLFPSGLAACSSAVLAFARAGGHILVSDSAYGPTRRVGARLLSRFGVTTQFYDPLIGKGIEALFRPETTLVVVEAPGSQTFEMQDVPLIAGLAKKHGITVMMDNTWATPLYFKPLDHGVDVSVLAATKYIVGHSDAMLGAITATREAWPKIREAFVDLGMHAGPDDAYLGQRGLRTMAVRLKQHWESGVQLAEWLARQPEVERVLHPALPSDPGHALWKRDFKGASGLFSVVLKEGVNQKAFAALIDGIELYGIGASWGGYESLAMPFDPREVRSVTDWPYKGPCFRVHAGLEAIDDLIADMDQGFGRLRRAL